MIDKRLKNTEIFQDTEEKYTTNTRLKEAVEKSKKSQIMVAESQNISIAETATGEGQVIVSGQRTFEAAQKYANQGSKVCVLNFASATNPGGGVTRGASAQEECLCRCSTLYPCLATDKLYRDFYREHRRANNPLYNDDCIYTPDVVVFKSDTDYPEMLPESDWWKVDVITCAAPNLRRLENEGGRITVDELRELLAKRIARIFRMAIKSRCKVLILGAFGCGAFQNPPQVVASIFAELTGKYRNYFDVIEYAVYHREREKANYEVFERAVKKLG